MSCRSPLLCLVALTAVLGACTKSSHTAYGLSGSTGTILTFDTGQPTTINNEATISNLPTGESLVQIAFRPSNAQLYGLTSGNKLCTVDASSGVITLVSASAFTSDTLGNVVLSFDPVNDQARVINNSHNLRVDPDSGALVATGTQPAFDSSDSNDGKAPSLAAIAYDNAKAGVSSTTLYGLDATTGSLVHIGAESTSDPAQADGGDLVTIGSVGITFNTGNAGFDIEPQDGLAYATLAASSFSTLYTIDLDSGAATKVDVIGSSNRTVTALAILPQ